MSGHMLQLVAPSGTRPGRGCFAARHNVNVVPTLLFTALRAAAER